MAHPSLIVYFLKADLYSASLESPHSPEIRIVLADVKRKEGNAAFRAGADAIAMDHFTAGLATISGVDTEAAKVVRDQIKNMMGTCSVIQGPRGLTKDPIIRNTDEGVVARRSTTSSEPVPEPPEENKYARRGINAQRAIQ